MSGIVASAPAAAGRRRQNAAWRRFAAHRLAVLGAAILLVLAFACAIGPLVMPFTDVFIDIRHRFAPPGAGAHVLGTDQLGRDMLARLLMAGRISLAVGLSAMAISMGIGVCVGLAAGYYGGLLGAALMRLVDAMLCFPSIFLLLAVSAFITPSVPSIVLLIASTSWMEVARIVEAQIRSLRERDYAIAAEALGASDARVMIRELLPNAIAPIVVAATLNVAHAILAESYISYLGYGIQATDAQLGEYAGQCAELFGERALARHSARRHDCAGGHQLQLPGGRAA